MAASPTPRRRLRAGLRAGILAVSCLAAGAAHAAGPLFVSHPANAFVSRDDKTIGGSVVGGDTIYASCEPGAYCEFYRPADLPNGSTFLGAELDGCSPINPTFSTAPMYVYVIRRGVSAGTRSVLASALFTPLGGDGCHFEYAVPAVPVAVDTFNNDYVVAVALGASGCLALECPILQATFQGVRLYYSVAAEGTVEPTTPSAFNPLPPP